MKDLPPEVLYFLLSFLHWKQVKQLTQISKRWRSFQLHFTRSIKLTKKIRDNEILKQLILKIPNVQSLDLSDQTELLKNDTLLYVLQKCLHLRELYLRGTYGYEYNSFKLISYLPSSLRKFQAEYLTDPDLQYLSTLTPHLEVLSLEDSHRITEKGLKKLCELTRLKKLKLVNFHFTEGASQVLSHAPALLSLELTWSSINDDGLRAICTNVVTLECLSLNECRKLTELALQHLSRNLRYLDLSYCKQFTDLSLEQLSSNCKYIQHLCLSNCNLLSDQGLKHLSECKYLSWLSLNKCPLVSDEGIKFLVDGCRFLSNLLLKKCVRLTDNSLQSLGGVKGLRTLDLSHCQLITDNGLGYLGVAGEQYRGGATSVLSSLALLHCSLISKQGLVLLSQGCKALTSLLLNKELTEHWNVLTSVPRSSPVTLKESDSSSSASASASSASPPLSQAFTTTTSTSSGLNVSSNYELNSTTPTTSFETPVDLQTSFGPVSSHGVKTETSPSLHNFRSNPRSSPLSPSIQFSSPSPSPSLSSSSSASALFPTYDLLSNAFSFPFLL